MAWAEKQLKRNAFNEIVPQYFDEALDDWVPYTGVYGEVTLSGNIAGLAVFDGVTITDTSLYTADVDVSKFTRIWVVAYSSLDKDPKLTIGFQRAPTQPMGGTPQVYNDASGAWERPEVTLKQYYLYALNTRFTWLDYTISQKLRFNMQCDIAPSAGAAYVTVFGEVYQ